MQNEKASSQRPPASDGYAAVNLRIGDSGREDVSSSGDAVLVFGELEQSASDARHEPGGQPVRDFFHATSVGPTGAADTSRNESVDGEPLSTDATLDLSGRCRVQVSRGP
jgi:hypothetical protein